MSATRKTRNQPDALQADSDKSSKKSVRPDEMTDEVIEFITAIDEYKRVYQRPFPSWSEVLDILKSLGYERAQ